MTLAQILTKARADLRNAVDLDTLVIWAAETQDDIGNLDIPLFKKRKTDFSSTSEQKEYDISDIGADVRKIHSIWYELQTTTDPYDHDYGQKQAWERKYFKFDQNDTNFWLEEDPEGKTLTIAYYRILTPITSQASSIDFATRWHRGIYIGIMKRAAEQKYKTPSGNWETLFDKFLGEMQANERSINRGPQTVRYYSVV